MDLGVWGIKVQRTGPFLREHLQNDKRAVGAHLKKEFKLNMAQNLWSFIWSLQKNPFCISIYVKSTKF